MFLLLMLFSILGEAIDLPHVIFNSPRTPINWIETIVEMSFIFTVSIIVIFILKKLTAKQFKSVAELYTKNQEYLALNEEYQAQNEELYNKNELLSDEIEKRKLTEDQLKNQFEQFITVYKNHPEIIYVSDPKTYELILVNDNFKEMLGYDPTGSKCYKSIRGLDEPCSFCTNKIITHNQGNPYTWESYNTLLDRHYVITDQLIEWSGRKKVRLELAVDITERKKSEEKIKASEEKFRSLFESMNEGIGYHKIICNKQNKPVDYIFLEVNDTFERFTGLKKENILNKRVTEVIPGIKKAKPDLIKIYGEVALTQKNTAFEIYFEPFNKWYKISAFSPNYGFFCAVFFDITLMKEAEQKITHMNEILEQKVKERTIKLEEVNKELEGFSYSVSHDLRAPLRAITGYAGILHEDYFNKLDDEGISTLNAIQDNSKNMARLIDDILEFSRLGRQDIKIQKLNMDMLFKTCYNELYQHENNRKIDLIINKVPSAGGDLTLIKVVINNLLSNALKYTRTRNIAQIFIDGHKENGKCIYKIEDNGIGFDEKYKDKLFGVFQRLISNREFEGTGVGLAIVQRIISRHGGEVWAKGSVNKGATFFFSLPA
jgi:signal transduction histidine kinase